MSKQLQTRLALQRETLVVLQHAALTAVAGGVRITQPTTGPSDTQPTCLLCMPKDITP